MIANQKKNNINPPSHYPNKLNCPRMVSIQANVHLRVKTQVKISLSEKRVRLATQMQTIAICGLKSGSQLEGGSILPFRGHVAVSGDLVTTGRGRCWHLVCRDQHPIIHRVAPLPAPDEELSCPKC